MRKKQTIIVAAAVALVAVLFLGAIVFYNGLLSERASEIGALNIQVADLRSQIVSLKSQVANLSGQTVNLTGGYLVTALGVREITDRGVYNPSPFNHLYIQGLVTNVGWGTAYNAGLHVVASDANGKAEVNMTIPLISYRKAYGTDSATIDYVLTLIEGETSLDLGKLAPGQFVTLDTSIFHEGNVTRWDITPVWTSQP